MAIRRGWKSVEVRPPSLIPRHRPRVRSNNWGQDTNLIAPLPHEMDSPVSNTLQASLEMTSYDSYVSSVEELAEAALSSRMNWEPSLLPSELLDGQAGATLRRSIPLQIRREQGAFFSSSDLRTAALKPSQEVIDSPGPFLDPAVGAGDLLIEVARHLPVEQDLPRTLWRWGQVLHGRDLEPVFVRLAKARLVLLAVERGAAGKFKDTDGLEEVLPEIKVGDGLELLARGWSGGHIVMNPPFTYRRASEETSWASGRTNVAAMFLAAAVAGAQSGTRLTAILPDVIRAGSRYGRLREIVDARLHMSSAKTYGQFDAWTDIDVFILRGVIEQSVASSAATQWWCPTNGEQMGDRYDIRVGPVVPHRDHETEPTHPYLRARDIPIGGEFDVSHADRRGFQSRLFHPPFVVIRRTSRPGDKSRGLGTVIRGTEGVLVENHLIILKSKDGSLDACRRIVDTLDSTHAREWLDNRIRCRHLTVRALSEMPWIGL